MKKLSALLLALCLICLAAAATAETAYVAEAKVLKLDDFTLSLSGGEYYELYEKTADQIYVMILPLYGNGDMSTNYYIGWEGTSFNDSAEAVKAERLPSEETVRGEYEAMGLKVESYTPGEPYETQLGGVNCVADDMTTTIIYSGQQISIYQRQYFLGSMGYVITFTGTSGELLEAATEHLAEAISFQ